MQSRACFDASDINRMVTTVPQAEILGEIRRATIVLSGELSEGIRFYWQDRLEAYRLALAIAEWYGKDLVTPEVTLKAENQALRQKLYDRLTTKTTVRGGVKYG